MKVNSVCDGSKDGEGESERPTLDLFTEPLLAIINNATWNERPY